MPRNDSIFLLTLIDFLFQIIFFGIFIFAIFMSSPGELYKNENIKKLQNYFGIGDLTELTDKLTRLAPLEDIRYSLEQTKKIGVKNESEAMKFIDQSGGRQHITDALRKLEEGVGKPHCLIESGDKKKAHILAEVTATDDRIAFTKETKDLRNLLIKLGIKFSDVQDIGLSEFREKFGSVIRVDPGCRYTLRFLEKTDYVYAREVVEKTFYLRIVH